jgi:hypothetical protein
VANYWDYLSGSSDDAPNPWMQRGAAPGPLGAPQSPQGAASVPGVTLNTPPPWTPPPPSAAPPPPLPSTPVQPPMDPNDRDMLIKTVYGEASNQPVLGQAGVAHAILNRLAAGGYSGDAPNTIANIVTAPAVGVNPARGFKEFSPWNAPGVPESNPTAQHLDPDDPRYLKIADVVDKAYYGGIPDPTGGATHYYGYMPQPPKWAAPLAAQNKVKIGGQTFVGLAGGPGQRPTVVGALGGG